MKKLHDSGVRDEFKARIAKLTPGAQRKWGKMTPDQMLWHCAESLETGLGIKPYGKMPPMLPVPKSWVRWMLLKGPWPKGRTPTAPDWVAKSTYDFEEQRKRLLSAVDALTSRGLSDAAARHPVLGDVSIEFQSQLHARHLNHHLEQFGV
jgi:hypothetical protein